MVVGLGQSDRAMHARMDKETGESRVFRSKSCLMPKLDSFCLKNSVSFDLQLVLCLSPVSQENKTFFSRLHKIHRCFALNFP